MVNETLENQLKELLLPPNPGDFEDGGEGPSIDVDTVNRTKGYIDQMKQLLSKEWKIDLWDPFRVNRDYEGGVDVHWREEGGYEGLMNISPNEPGTYFWNNINDKSICLQGKFDL